jgi:hypothetical protein
MDDLLGDMAALTRRGFFGHIGGKYFVRKKYAAKNLRAHRAVPEDASLLTGVMFPGLELLHFYALTFLDWKEKWARRISGEEYYAKHERGWRQLNLFKQAYDRRDDKALFAIYKKMWVVESSILTKSVEAGFIVKRSCSLPPWPTLQLDGSH